MKCDNEFDQLHIDEWLLCDELTVEQAVLLYCGVCPPQLDCREYEHPPKYRPSNYDATFTAISNAITSGRLPATIIYDGDFNIKWNVTKVLVDDLREWLRGRGISTGFFFPTATDVPSYLDRKHPHYAPKLAAAVNAWLAVNEETTIEGKSVKQTLTDWLRVHAAEYKLSDDNGKPNETGIEQCAKVANWQDKGGAPKTPSG